MIDKLQAVITRHDELAEFMSQPDAMQDMKAFTKKAREHRSLTNLVKEAKNILIHLISCRRMKKFSMGMIPN